MLNIGLYLEISMTIKHHTAKYKQLVLILL